MSNNITPYYYQVLEKLFGSTEKRRKFIDYAISVLNDKWNEYNIFIIDAPTGYGKTTISASISLFTINEELKSIVILPLRSLIEDQYERFKKITEFVGKRYMNNPDSKYLLKPVTLTTIDTFALTFFGLSPEDFDKVVKYWSGTAIGSLGHFLFSCASIILSNIILDEVQLLIDQTKSLNFLIALMKSIIRNNQKLIIMSATIPTAFENLIKKELREYINKIKFIKFGEHSTDEYFINERLSKNYKINIIGLNESNKEDYIKNYIYNKINEYGKIIVIFNTVKDAISFYQKLSIDNIPKILLHSRFNEEDKEKKINKLKEIKKSNKYIVISTQVIEAGIDISSNLMITEIAPINSLIQRIGRFLRYEGENNGDLLIWYEVDENNELKKTYDKYDKCHKYKVYDYDLTKRTLTLLLGMKNKGEKINFHIPYSNSVIGYKELIDKIYNENDMEINRNDITKLINITSKIEDMSYSAFKNLLMRLEGSFIRNSMLIPIIPKSVFEENKDKYEKMIKLIIPISFNLFLELIKNSLIKEYITKDYKGLFEIKSLSNNQIKMFDNFSGLLKFLYINDVLAFVANIEYDNEKGLIVEYE
ncbi:MAG: CRISPR-associated helicase Cas3' [Candidatus Verstraetearchaeota archaeon]|jgi:CRISPR-associated endonuclease/helicase Cas3|nr:CRISPR-associated helicase Cas3' [Candidatus Verstraetearchaeota archaeon]